MSYSIDFRRKVLSVREKEGLSIRETAKRFHIGSASVSRWPNQIDPKPSTTRQRKIDKSALEKDVELYPDAYQKERAERFGVCHKAIFQAFKKLGLTYKKKLCIIPKPTKLHGKYFNKKYNNMNLKEKISFILMRVVLQRKCHGPTVIL